jgi:predicted phosphodiesterase
MDELKRMEEVYKADPSIGRIRLMEAASVTDYAAKTFIHKMRGVEKVKAEVKKIDPFDGLSVAEKKLILRGLKSPAPAEKMSFKWSEDHFKFAHVSDTHWGHVKAKAEYWQQACDLIDKEGCKVILHTGDITEGMAPRAGQIYELDAIGASAQIDHAVGRLSIAPCPVYALNGNHDLWGYKTLGFNVAQTLQDRLPGKFFNLGMHEADYMAGNIKIKLWHGEDGGSYAVSYRSQKFIEGLSGGEKPHILLTGHDHKSIQYQCRNVMVFGGGTLCGQTGWMRNKKLACHVGFWIIEVWQNKSGLERIRGEWVPFFIEGYLNQ